ncbi:MFS transporter [Intrasporangium oryzae NRRL B-24470]|uniref:MFS transporter n=1 Tax=Intrasporangium oryzae NRRL B-24470 TaxID=1386089 RepID=W9G8S4_9MICO|nr:MFS transporter [Intrasporangium oryzae]EWT00274.1 MFS transporter [Intrasporangium oryzae NRRL B-24470]
MSTTTVLRLRDMRLLLIGQGLSWVGDAFNPIALSVAVVLGGGGARELGTILAAGVVARLVCTLFGGVWADRLSPHRIMVAADSVRAVAALGMAVAFALGNPPVALLAALAAVASGAGAFFFPAFVSLRPLVVPAEERQSANAVVSFLQSAAQIAGPVLAGVVVAGLGPVVGFGINAASFVWSAVCVSLVRARADRRAERRSMWAETGEGLAEIRAHTWLWTGLVAAGFFHIATGILVVLVEVTAVRDLGGAHALGLITAAQGVGGILGGALAMRVQPRRTLLWAFVALGIFPLFPLAFAWPGTLLGILALALVANVGMMFFAVGWDTALQDGIPHDRLARVVSWDILISFVALPVGNVLAGSVGEAFSTTTVMAVIAVWMLVAGCAPLLARSTRAFTRGGAGAGVAGPEPAAASEDVSPQPSAATAAS